MYFLKMMEMAQVKSLQSRADDQSAGHQKSGKDLADSAGKQGH